MLFQGLPVGFPHVDVEAELCHVVRQERLDFSLVAGNARYLDHVLEKLERLEAAQ